MTGTLDISQLVNLSGLVLPDRYPTSGATGGLTPTQIRHAYGFDALTVSGVAGIGTGQTIAIIDAAHDAGATATANFDIGANLDAFDEEFKIDGSTQTLYQQYGAASQFLTVHQMTTGLQYDAGWAGEIALDVEWAHAPFQVTKRGWA